MFKQTFRQDAKYFRGFRSTNNGIDLKNNQNKAYVKIMPVGVGRLSNIKQKGQSIFGRAFKEEPQSSDKYKTLYVNPLWGYLFLIATSYQKIFVSQNKTQIEFEEDFTKQVIREMRYQILEKKVKQILLDRINYVFDNLEIAFRRIMKKEGINNASRSQKLYFFKRWIAEQGENVKPATKQFLRKSFNQKNGEMDMFQKYVDQLLLSIQDIQPLKISQQTIKFKNFDKIHRETFKAQFITEKIRGVNNFYIKVAKLSSESEPVLQRLNDFVQLRLSSGVPEAEYKTETVSFIRDLYTQMQKYQNNTGKTGCRTPYYYLNPENIIVDQLTLTPKLHYEPALLQAFGLRRNCFSLESRLSFQPTPKGPDFFRSLEELDQANQLKLRDPLYGEIEFYYLDIAKMTSDEMREIKIEKIELQKLKVLIAIWRFLLVSYYINTGKKFGRKLNPISYLEVQKHFQKSLKQKKNQLKKNACELKQFLGVENRRFEGVQFQWKLQEIGEYLQLQNDESIIKDHRFTKKLRYFILRWTLIGQLNSALRNNKVIPKFLNVKRYILMYLFNAHEIYVENMELLEVQKIKSGQRKILRKLIEHKSQELRKDYFSDAKSNLDNINKYLTRNPEKDPQTKYLASSKYFHNLLIGILDQLDKINTICQQLNTIENKEQNNIPLLERNQYKNKLLKLQERLNEGYRKVHIITGQFVTLQIFNKSIDQLYKYTDQQKQRDFNKLQKKKIALQFYTYLSLNLNKYFLYQTAVAPLIVSYRGLNQNEQPVLIDHQKLEEQNYKLQAIEQAIELKNIIGKQLQYLKNPNDQSTQAEKISSDIPNNQLNSHLKQDKQKFVNPKLGKGGKNNAQVQRLNIK